MIKVKTYIQLIPEKVFQNLAVIVDLLEHEINGFNLDYLKEILSIIACHVRKEDDSTPLQMEYLRKLVPYAERYIIGLISLNIIQRSPYYIPGSKCYKYNFSKEYESKFISIPLKNPKLTTRIEQAQKEFIHQAQKAVRGQSEQTSFLKLLEIDTKYTKYLDTKELSTEQYNYILGSATRILNNDIFYSIDSTSGRFHSNLTNMPKELRPYLRVKNEPLINIDVKNSQPYLSTIILTNPGKVSWMTENPAFAMLLQTLKVSHNEDVKNYISLVISGQLYEFMIAEFLKEGLKLTREETKDQVLRILFARNRLPKNSINRQARLIFKKVFPTVHRIFSKIRGRERGYKFTSFKRFAILLQRIESYLMLDVILKRIYRELPGTIAMTIHDSIMTGILTNNVEEVRKIMEEELTFFVGFAPKIKIEENIEERKKETVYTITLN